MEEFSDFTLLSTSLDYSLYSLFNEMNHCYKSPITGFIYKIACICKESSGIIIDNVDILRDISEKYGVYGYTMSNDYEFLFSLYSMKYKLSVTDGSNYTFEDLFKVYKNLIISEDAARDIEYFKERAGL